MAITFYQHFYRFPFVEEYNYWLIEYESPTSSEGLIKIKAKIKPSIKALLSLLIRSNRIDSTDVDMHSGYIKSQKGITYVNALKEFCETKYNITIQKWGYSFGDAFTGGNTSGTDKAIKKIKKEIDEQFSYDLSKELIIFLGTKGL